MLSLLLLICCSANYTSRCNAALKLQGVSTTSGFRPHVHSKLTSLCLRLYISNLSLYGRSMACSVLPQLAVTELVSRPDEPSIKSMTGQRPVHPDMCCLAVMLSCVQYKEEYTNQLSLLANATTTPKSPCIVQVVRFILKLKPFTNCRWHTWA